MTSGITNRQGSCTLFYMPEKSEGEAASAYYRDYLIYADKEGYLPASWSTTRYYGTDIIYDRDFTITLSPLDETIAQSMPDFAEEPGDATAEQGEPPFTVSGT